MHAALPVMVVVRSRAQARKLTTCRCVCTTAADSTTICNRTAAAVADGAPPAVVLHHPPADWVTHHLPLYWNSTCQASYASWARPILRSVLATP